jgi:predicted metal-dependent hydrolase
LPHLARRLTDWLKLAARQELTAAAQRYAAAMGVGFRRITVRDQKSRWGSCSAAGDLSFSWRLVLTPAHVLDYVAAHEVAHLKHMDHGPQFWRLVLKHCPDAVRAKKWLKTNGQDVHRIAAG